MTSTLTTHKSLRRINGAPGRQALLALAFAPANSSIMALLNSGISDGWRLLTQLRSRTACWLTQLPPALRMSSWMV